MGRKINFEHIAVRSETKKELEKLKQQLGEFYDDVSYEKLMRIFLEKNKKLVLSSKEVSDIINKKRCVNYDI